jgi:hypothetical protein
LFGPILRGQRAAIRNLIDNDFHFHIDTERVGNNNFIRSQKSKRGMRRGNGASLGSRGGNKCEVPSGAGLIVLLPRFASPFTSAHFAVNKKQIHRFWDIDGITLLEARGERASEGASRRTKEERRLFFCNSF